MNGTTIMSELTVKRVSGKYIEAVYYNTLESVARMVFEHYDTDEYEDTTFYINTYMTTNFSLLSKEYFTRGRNIYYCLERKIEDAYLINWIKEFGITDIWLMDYTSELYDDCVVKFGIKPEIRPMRYTTNIKKIGTTTNPNIDLLFFGNISPQHSPFRADFFNQYNFAGYFSLVTVNNMVFEEADTLVKSSKFILDMPRELPYSIQNQVRLFEAICGGKTVLSMKCKKNIFPGLIYEWEDLWELIDLINTVQPIDVSEKYKEMTYTDINYNNYIKNIIVNE